MPKYQITVHSCRKDTVVLMHLNSWQANLVRRLAKLTQEKSRSECEPTISIDPVTTLRPTSSGDNEARDVGKVESL